MHSPSLFVVFIAVVIESAKANCVANVTLLVSCLGRITCYSMRIVLFLAINERILFLTKRNFDSHRLWP